MADCTSSPRRPRSDRYGPARKASTECYERRILTSMPKSTTIKVSVSTRDALRQLAERDGLTLDAQLDRLVRRERRRTIGAQLASSPLDTDEVAMLDASAIDVADASR